MTLREVAGRRVEAGVEQRRRRRHLPCRIERPDDPRGVDRCEQRRGRIASDRAEARGTRRDRRHRGYEIDPGIAVARLRHEPRRREDPVGPSTKATRHLRQAVVVHRDCSSDAMAEASAGSASVVNHASSISSRELGTREAESHHEHVRIVPPASARCSRCVGAQRRPDPRDLVRRDRRARPGPAEQHRGGALTTGDELPDARGRPRPNPRRCRRAARRARARGRAPRDRRRRHRSGPCARRSRERSAHGQVRGPSACCTSARRSKR